MQAAGPLQYRRSRGCLLALRVRRSSGDVAYRYRWPIYYTEICLELVTAADFHSSLPQLQPENGNPCSQQQTPGSRSNTCSSRLQLLWHSRFSSGVAAYPACPISMRLNHSCQKCSLHVKVLPSLQASGQRAADSGGAARHRDSRRAQCSDGSRTAGGAVCLPQQYRHRATLSNFCGPCQFRPGPQSSQSLS